MTQVIKLKRTYNPASPDDGYRVFVDRLWPRGLSHETFHYDLWEKAVAPSTQLREWFHAAPAVERYDEFAQRYEAELKMNPALTDLAKTIADKPVVTLLYSCHDPERNNAVVVREMLLKLLPQAKAE